MATPSKPSLTGSSHTLPFGKLSPHDFERLCLWLVRREGYTQAEHLGEAGSEQGRDVLAWKDGRRVAFQCKRVKAFTAATTLAEIAKLHGLPNEEQPDELVFVVSQAVRVETRNAARKAWGDEATCHFWAGNELDEKVKRHPDLLREFFQLPPDKTQAAFRHNLPYASLNTLFQGREEILTRLRETLERIPAGRATAIAGKAVHGLGGVGKTRLAVEYAWRHAAEYSTVLFVGAGSPADLRRNLAALSSVLDLPEQEAKEEEVREAAVLRWLGEQPGWLLILDNVDSKDAAAAVDSLVSRLHGGHVLLTGRLARWGVEVEPIELDVLVEEAAVEFLLARTEKRRATKEDPTHASTLARELGGLPLALEQAGAYISERRLTLAAYLEEWRSRHDHVLSWFDEGISRYHASVAVTWQTSFDRLSAPARRLLERLAWLGPEPIPESLLDVPIPDLPEPEPDLRDALVELETYSLVTRAGETPTFTVHRLVQDVTRRSLKNDPGNEALSQALRWLDDAFAGEGHPQDVRTWPILEPLAPHAHAVASFADSADIAGPTARLMNNLGQLLDAKARLDEAEPLMRRALAIDEKSLGPEHPNVATDLNNLAQLLQATNRLDEAEPLMQRALAIDENSLGPEHPQVAVTLSNLAVLLKATNRLVEAEPLTRRALAISEKSFGSEHPDVATDLNNLALLLQDTDRLDEAEPLMRRALDIDEHSFGPQHPNAAIRLNNLASLLWSTNRFDEAEPLMRRALDIDENSFGPQHPRVAIRLNNLAQLLQATNRLTEAEPLMLRALVIFLEFSRRTEHEHPRLQAAFGNYANLLQEMGKSEAEIEATIEALRS